MPLLDVVAAADRAVVVEITEHAEIDDYSRLVAALEQVRPHAMLAVDDAGAGYAGLHHILELRPHFVKLDISLVRNIDSDPARQAMVSSMTRFASSVRCALIAEGIETESELEALKLLKVEYGQGYFLARPAPIDALGPCGRRGLFHERRHQEATAEPQGRVVERPRSRHGSRPQFGRSVGPKCNYWRG
jgi:EAL domain-containing protein (putative c-di-GMP-specific phosphodiesterase class I)